MSLTKIKGQNFRVFVSPGPGESHASATAVHEASSCQVSISGNMESSKTKDSEGSFQQEQMVSRGWQVQVDSYQATASELQGIIDQFLSDEPVPCGWDQTATTAGTMNRNAANAAFARSGNARLVDFTLTANNRTPITLSRQYQGTGALS